MTILSPFLNLLSSSLKQPKGSFKTINQSMSLSCLNSSMAWQLPLALGMRSKYLTITHKSAWVSPYLTLHLHLVPPTFHPHSATLGPLYLLIFLPGMLWNSNLLPSFEWQTSYFHPSVSIKWYLTESCQITPFKTSSIYSFTRFCLFFS